MTFKGNIMQRVFHTLRTSGPMTIRQLEQALPFDDITIKRALKRLRTIRALESHCGKQHTWLYSAKPCMEIPEDRRGMRRAA